MLPGYIRQLFYPAPVLRDVVESYSVLTPSVQSASSVPWHIMPDGAAYILFHVFDAKGRDSKRDACYQSRLAFVGPRSTYVFTDRKRRVLSLIAQFRPGAAFLPVSHPFFELTDRSFTLEELLSLNLSEVQEELSALAVSNQITKLIHRFDHLMMTVSDAHMKQHALANAAVRCIDKAKGQVSVRALSDALGVSDRHLRSVFNKVIGLSPKRYTRIIRLTETVRAVDSGYAFGWAQLAINAGYYDQSHMIDEFQELVGESTDAFISRPNREEVCMPASDFSNT